MPIRFRCAYCNQLMGIARRKAGTVVKCPSCAGQVIVPGAAPTEARSATGAGGLFDVADIDKELFQPPDRPASAPGPVAVTDTSAGAPRTAPSYDVVPLHTAPGGEPLDLETGIFLSRGKVTVLSVLVVVLLALAFWLGYLIGAG